MKLKVLGPVQVTDGGRNLDLGPRMQRAVLALLAMQANRVVSVDHLVDQLWGDQPPATATTALQGHVAALRRILEPNRPARTPPRVLLTQPPGYLLRIDPADFDAARFEAQVAEGREWLGSGRPEAARNVLGSALALWRGVPYADLAYERFVGPEAARLEELRAVAAEARAEADLMLGDHANAAGDLERLVAADPLRERLWELYALALYRCGRQADALRALDRARRTLAEELGIEPCPSLRQLEQDILHQASSIEWKASATDARPGAVTAPPAPARPAEEGPGTLVGRSREMSQLEDALRQACSGRGGVVLLAGEPGIGKTRLAEELSARAVQDGARVAWGRCHEGDEAPAFWPWMQVVRTLADGLDEEALRAALGAGAADIAQIVPEVKHAAGDLVPVTTFDPAMARSRLYDALSQFLLRVAASAPLVLVLDDIHWADPPSVQLFTFLTGQLSAASVLVVATYRDAELSSTGPLAAALGRTARGPNVSRLALTGLDRSDVARLVILSWENEGETSEELLDVLWARTQGNPFFVAELVRLRQTQGDLGHEIPERVRDVIGRRLALLPEETARALAVGSVIGAEFHLDVLAEAGGWDAETILERTEDALASRLLVERPEAVGSYRFSHPLVRETLYDGLSAMRRARLHLRVAQALEALGRAEPLELAHHYWQAAAAPAAVTAAFEWAERAAEQAIARLAYEQAEELLERAVALLRRLPSGVERDRRELDVQSRLCLLQLMTKGKGAEEVGRSAARAADLGAQLGDARQMGRALYRLASFHAMRGEIDRAGQRSGQLLAAAEASGDRILLLLGLLAHGYADLYRGRLHEARAALERAAEMDDLLQDVTLIPVLGQHAGVGCWGYLAMVLGLLGEEERAAELTARALLVAEELGHPFTLAYALHYDAWLAIVRRDILHGRERSEQARDAWRRGGFPVWGNAVGAMLGWFRTQLGEVEEGVADITVNLAEWEASGARRYKHYFLALLAEGQLLAGRPEDAVVTIVDALQEVAHTGERFYEAELHRLRGEALAHLPGREPGQVEVAFRKAVAVARDQGAALLERRSAASLETFLSLSGRVV